MKCPCVRACACVHGRVWECILLRQFSFHTYRCAIIFACACAYTYVIYEINVGTLTLASPHFTCSEIVSTFELIRRTVAAAFTLFRSLSKFANHFRRFAFINLTVCHTLVMLTSHPHWFIRIYFSASTILIPIKANSIKFVDANRDCRHFCYLAMGDAWLKDSSVSYTHTMYNRTHCNAIQRWQGIFHTLSCVVWMHASPKLMPSNDCYILCFYLI